MLVCALFLMFDLSDDGNPGKASYAVPPVKSLEVASGQHGAGASDRHNELLPDKLPYIFRQSPSQPVTLIVMQTLQSHQFRRHPRVTSLPFAARFLVGLLLV
jgi:hypothetical protein